MVDAVEDEPDLSQHLTALFISTRNLESFIFLSLELSHRTPGSTSLVG